MPTGNPLDQLRRRMQSHATPAAFAALAEEHRRAGRLDEAIAVCRDGLAQYPAYVSARVTLGRALLDTGDLTGAIEALEQAVAQAPDNFAAVRALDAARAALALAPPRLIGPPPDLALQAPASEDTADIPMDLVARAWGTGADGPQEFGLGPDWTLPAPPPLPPAPEEPAAGVPPEADTAVAFAHGDAPTMCFTPPHLQGEEPAGIWPVPAPSASAPITDAAPVFSWALDPPAGEGTTPAALHESPAVPSPGIWDAPTIDAPLVSFDAAGPEPAEPTAGDAPAHFWSDFGDAGTGASDPVPFAGWADVPPPAGEAAARPSSAWDQDDATGAWAVQDGPSAAWALAGPDEVSTTPFQDVLGQDEERVVPASFTTREATGVDPVPFGDPAEAVPEGAWQGSLASALDEVFARAGAPDSSREPMPTAIESTPTDLSGVRMAMADVAVEALRTDAVGSLEPPTSEITAVRMAMADLAVEAAIEDAAQVDPAPALASLEQLLAAVRARRATLFSHLPS